MTSEGCSYEDTIAEQIFQWAVTKKSPFKLSEAKNAFMKVSIPILEDACEVLLEQKRISSSGGRVVTFQIIQDARLVPLSCSVPVF